MARSALLLTSTLILSACGSAELLDDSEIYLGRYTAAVAPVADHSIGGPKSGIARTPAQVQQSIRLILDQAGIFEGVVALERHDQGNEAEVIIEPALAGGRDKPELKVTVREKSSGRIVLNEVYRGGNDIIPVAVNTLEQDLEDHYGGRQTVY